ncbi:hypothetical protein PoB_002167800 [Plakobranchus ocellatus]|uniref:Uncharacterized protein n=1 Tax=Plakobranchus ocellatus TaxID=259542 RepID=A0AAV3ZKR6_9GAST|nr:hypothetical protein PoB_002167800 [Plakobranchus ocellatus]
MESNNKWHPLIYNIDHTEVHQGHEQQLQQQQQSPPQQQQQPPQQQQRQQQQQPPRQQQQQLPPPPQQQQQQQRQGNLQNQGPSEFNIPYQSHGSRPYGSSDYATLLLQADPRFSNFTTSQMPASLGQDHRLSTGIDAQAASTNFRYERVGLENNGHMINVPQPRKPIAKKIDMRPVEFYFQDKHLFNSPFPDVVPKSSVNQTLPTSFPLDPIRPNGSHPFSTLHTPQALLYSMNPAVMAEPIPNFTINSESLLPHMTNAIPFSNNSIPYSLNALAHGVHLAPIPSATGLRYQNIAPNLHSSAYQTFNPSSHINIHPAFPQARDLQKTIGMHGKGEPAACGLNPVQRDTNGRSVKTGRKRKAPASKKSDRIRRRSDRERQNTVQSSELHSSTQPRENQNGHSQRMNLQSLHQSVRNDPQKACQHNFTAEQAIMPQVANTVGTNEEPRCVSKSVQKEPVDFSYTKSNPMINQQLERSRGADESCSSTEKASAQILDSKQPESDTTNKETATERACPNQRAKPQPNEDYNDILLRLKMIAETPVSNINVTSHSINSSHNNENKMLLHKTNSLNGDRKNDLPHSLAYSSVLAKNNELSHSLTSSLACARNNESTQSQATFSTFAKESDLPHSFIPSLPFSRENASSRSLASSSALIRENELPNFLAFSSAFARENELPHSFLPYSTFTMGNELPHSLASYSEFARKNELLQSLASSAAPIRGNQSRHFLACSSALGRENELPHFLASSSTITKENELPHSHAPSSSLTRGNELPHFLASSSSLTKGNELPYSLATSSTFNRGNELPHSLASSSTFVWGNELPHSLASSSTLIRGNELPHSLASSSALTKENELPHSLATSPTLTRENESPHSLASSSVLTKESESTHSLTSSSTLIRRNELPHPLASSSALTKENELPHSLAPSPALTRENESPHSLASSSTLIRGYELPYSLAPSSSTVPRENELPHSLASSPALTRENESRHSLTPSSALGRENESPNSLASFSVFEATVQLHGSDRETPVSEKSAGTNKDHVNENDDPVNIVLCTDQDSKPTKNISTTKLSSNSFNQLTSKIEAQLTKDKPEVLGEQYQSPESLPLIHSHNEDTKAQFTPTLNSIYGDKLPFKKRLENLMPTERTAAFALVGLAENDLSSSHKHSDKDQPHVHQTAGPSRTESTSENVSKESLSREKDLPRPDVCRSPEINNKKSEHFLKSTSNSVEIVHHVENLKEDGNSFMTSLQLSTELGKVNRKWYTMKKYGTNRGVNHHSDHEILKMSNEMKPSQQFPTDKVITNQHKERNVHTEAKHTAAVRPNTSWPASTSESTPDSIRRDNSTPGTVTDVTAPCSSDLTRSLNMTETSTGPCIESISSASYSQYISCKPYESELSMYNSGVGARNRQCQESTSCESILQNNQAKCLEGIYNLQTTRLKGGKNLSAERCNKNTGSTFKRWKIKGKTIKSRKTASDHSAVNATGVDETSDSPNLTMVGVETTSRIPLVNDSPLCSNNEIEIADTGYETTHGFDLLVTAIEKKEQSSSIHESARQDLFGFNHKTPTLNTGPNNISETDTNALDYRRTIEENQLQHCIKNENLKRINPKTNAKAFEEEKKSASKTDDALDNQNMLTALEIENTSDSDNIHERFLKQGQNNLPLRSDNTFDPKYHFLDKDSSVVTNNSSNNHDQYPESKKGKKEPFARSKEEISTLPLTVPAARENTSKIEPLPSLEEEKSTQSHTLSTESKNNSENKDRNSSDNKTDTLSDSDDLKQDPVKSNPAFEYYSDSSLNRLITPKLIDRYHSDFLKTFFLKKDNDEKDSMSSPEEITVYATNPRNSQQAACSKTLYKDSLDGKDIERNVKTLSYGYPSPSGNASTELCQNGKTTQSQYLMSSKNSACGSETSRPTHGSYKKPINTSNTTLSDTNLCGGTRLDETASISSTSSTSCSTSTSLETERRLDSVSCSVTLSSPESKADYSIINATDVEIQDVKKRHKANDNEVNSKTDRLPKRDSTSYLRDSKHKSKSECSNTPTFPLTKNLINIPDILAGTHVSVAQHDNQDSEDLENHPHGKSTETCLKGEPTATSSTKKQRNHEDSPEPPTLRPVVTGDDVFSSSLGHDFKTPILRRASHSSPDLLPSLYVMPHDILAERPQHKAPRRINADVICEG